MGAGLCGDKGESEHGGASGEREWGSFREIEGAGVLQAAQGGCARGGVQQGSAMAEAMELAM